MLNKPKLMDWTSSSRPTKQFNFVSGTNVLPSDITFTRASNATYYNSAGVLTTAGNNVPRYDYDPATLLLKGLLIEQSIANLTLQSNNIVSPWGLMNGATKTDNATISPDGTMDATLITFTTTFSSLQQLIALTASTVYTISFWAKNNAGTNTYNVWDDTPNASLGTFTPTSSWVRYSFTFTPATTASHQLNFIQDRNASGFGSIYVYGFQLEALGFATSYVATTGSTATRAVDSAIVSSLPWFNSTSGTLAANLIVEGLGTVAQGSLAFSDGTTANRFELRANAGGGTDQFLIQAASATQYSALSTGPITNVLFKQAMAYSSANAQGAQQGVTVSGSGAITLPTGISQLILGGTADGSSLKLIGWLQSFRYWNYALSSAQLQQVTT